MSAADEAYAAALAEIERVRAEGGTRLDFSREPFRALDRIPPEIAGVEGLTWLDLTNTQVADLTHLANLTALQSLLLTNTKVADLRPLANLSALRSLSLDNTTVADLARLAALTALRSLSLDNTPVADLTRLANITALRALRFRNTPVSDLSPLASLTALRTLNLDNTPVANLTPLASLTELRSLSLENTSVSDLSPLANIIALRALRLRNTPVADLRPIRGMRGPRDLAEDTDGFDGLDFADTPFAKATADTRRLAAIAQRRERTIETLAFLNTLPPPPASLPWEVAAVEAAAATNAPVMPPEQDPALPLVWGPRGFDFLVQTIGLDPVTRETLAELRDLLDTLIRQSGNSHEDVHRLATEMRARCETENGTLNALALHLSFQKLERLHVGRAARERPLDDEIVTTLESILTVAPGATLGDPKVAELIARQDANRSPRPPVETARADAVLAAVAQPEAPFALEVQTVAAAAQGGGDDRLAATGTILARNVVVAVGRFLARIASSPSEMVAGGILVTWVWTNWPTLRAYALSLGTDVAVWLTRVVQELGKIAPPL